VFVVRAGMQATGVMEMGYIYMRRLMNNVMLMLVVLVGIEARRSFPIFLPCCLACLLYVESQHYHKRNYTVLYMLIYLLWWCLHARYIGLSSARCEPRRKK